MSSVTRCESLQSIHHGHRPYVCIGVYKCTVGTFMTAIMALLLHEFNAFSFSGQRGSSSSKQISFLYGGGPAAPTGCHADFQSTAEPTWRYAAPVNVSAMGTAVKKKKCLQSQSVIRCVPSYSTNSESLRRKVHLDCDRMYRADCKWLLDRLYMCGHTSHRLRSSNILRIAPIRYGANKISLPLPNFVSRLAPSAVHYTTYRWFEKKRTHKPNYCPMKGKR